MRRWLTLVASVAALFLAPHAASPWLSAVERKAGAVATAIPRDRDGFRLAAPPYTFRFPGDHAAHTEFRTEWWYYTGHLAAPGRAFGYELTFFRVALPQRRTASPSFARPGSGWSSGSAAERRSRWEASRWADGSRA